MGSKLLDTNMIAPMADVYDVLQRTESLDWLKAHLLANLSTSGAGDFANLDELAYYVHGAIHIAFSIRDDELIFEPEDTP